MTREYLVIRPQDTAAFFAAIEALDELRPRNSPGAWERPVRSSPAEGSRSSHSPCDGRVACDVRLETEPGGESGRASVDRGYGVCDRCRELGELVVVEVHDRGPTHKALWCRLCADAEARPCAHCGRLVQDRVATCDCGDYVCEDERCRRDHWWYCGGMGRSS